ncbi:hypothetical protein [Acidovorax sp. SUPP2539]|uniref:hypothetical protein n=1 Tax=Acidovorax sp. SUPP2539 TaxID=2920878 RepID=UPI0023DE6AEC|nr:hypothetical protein [Acidovorax sp. SUPP2539]GKS90647.1 hypothetical protein AVTE2539_14800 [Acidovorax sp. SUPP2539]
MDHHTIASQATVPPEGQAPGSLEHLQAALAQALAQIAYLEEEKRQMLLAANHVHWLTML